MLSIIGIPICASTALWVASIDSTPSKLACSYTNGAILHINGQAWLLSLLKGTLLKLVFHKSSDSQIERIPGQRIPRPGRGFLHSLSLLTVLATNNKTVSVEYGEMNAILLESMCVVFLKQIMVCLSLGSMKHFLFSQLRPVPRLLLKRSYLTLRIPRRFL